MTAERRVVSARARALTIAMLRGQPGRRTVPELAAIVHGVADEDVPPRVVRVEWSDGTREDVRV